MAVGCNERGAWYMCKVADWYMSVQNVVGKPLSKCGKCSRYMKLISVRPSRMYCPTCEEVLALPQVLTPSPSLYWHAAAQLAREHAQPSMMPRHVQVSDAQVDSAECCVSWGAREGP